MNLHEIPPLIIMVSVGIIFLQELIARRHDHVSTEVDDIREEIIQLNLQKSSEKLARLKGVVHLDTYNMRRFEELSLSASNRLSAWFNKSRFVMAQHDLHTDQKKYRRELVRHERMKAGLMPKAFSLSLEQRKRHLVNL